MNTPLTRLLKSYEELPSMQQKVINLLIVYFSDISMFDATQYFRKYLDDRTLVKEYEKVIKNLIKRELVTNLDKKICATTELMLELFPTLIKQEFYKGIIKQEQKELKINHWFVQAKQCLRDYLFAAFVEPNNYTSFATDKLMREPESFLELYEKMLERPAYDKALIYSPELFSLMMQRVRLDNLFSLKDFKITLQFCERNEGYTGLLNQLIFQRAEIYLHSGQMDKAFSSVKTENSRAALLLKSQIALFQADFGMSAALMEQARITDQDGSRTSRMIFGYYNEFFYWLIYVFNPEALNLKKLVSFIKKANNVNYPQYEILLPLLHILQKDRAGAEASLNSLIKEYSVLEPNLDLFLLLIMDYIITGKLSGPMRKIAPDLCKALKNNDQELFLRELVFIMDQVDIKVPPVLLPLSSLNNLPPCLMSYVMHQERWEQFLDGLLNLTESNPATLKKEDSTYRICYLVNFKNGTVQPILQSSNSKGNWSSGRSIALKRLKECQVEGMTDQDRRVAGTIIRNTGYYGADQYYFDTDKTFVELCGHPLLFLYTNPTIPVELIKVQPEIITEKLNKGILLKTNVPDPDKPVNLMKETQTRYKLMSLNSHQRSIIRMINEGIAIPSKGKEKLVKTVSNLSRVMTVHSDIIAEGSSAIKTIRADSRIRVQILPFGNGLKAGIYVKPLGTEPPYLKPGKGGKVVYGFIDGEKNQAIRDLSVEAANSEKFSNAVALNLDIDLMEEEAAFTDPWQCLNLLETINQNSDIAIAEWPEGEQFRLKRYASFENLHLRAKGKGQWFELEGELRIDENTVLNLQELLSLVRNGKGRFLELKPGEFIALTEEFQKQIHELETYARIDKSGVSVSRFAAHSLEDLTKQAASFKSDKNWKDFHHRVKEAATAEVQIPAALVADLRPYQEEGFRWLARLHAWDAGGCLADDMGLGKTIQAIAMMLHLAEKGPSLVVCPASVISNWGEELRKFAPTLSVNFLKATNREETLTALASFDVLVITYGLLQSEEKRIASIQWTMAVLDEAHAIKNNHTKSSKAAMSIKAGFKLALTGTPVQNHLGELWNLFNYCNPGLLGSLAQFTERYLKNEIPQQKNRLKKLISPFILRRTKNKVLDELPPKTEITQLIELSEEEMAFYEALRREAVLALENNEGSNGQQHLQALAEITKLRLACCNPALVNKEIKLTSSKMDAFLEIILELKANNHRALVFSQFVVHLALIREALDKQGISYQYLDGSTPVAERESIVKAFQTGKGDLFLISLKAGGLGLNLTAADYVLHLDPWWNPAIEDQASDRAHRIGQTRPVTIYRLVAKNTIEEKILRLHATKREMATNLLDGTDQSARLSTKELLELLREV